MLPASFTFCLRPSILRPLGFVFILFGFMGCSKSDPTAPVPLPLPPSISGSWTMSVAGGYAGQFSLKEEETAFNGSGSFAGVSANIAGENHYPKVKFSMGNPGYAPAVFTGSFSSLTVITGVFNESGFANTPVTLTKN